MYNVCVRYVCVHVCGVGGRSEGRTEKINTEAEDTNKSLTLITLRGALAFRASQTTEISTGNKLLSRTQLFIKSNAVRS